MQKKISHALVLGGGLAGLLSAIVLADRAESVTVVERDKFPDSQAHRKGVPHSKHTHGLVSGGARALDELLPGATDSLFNAGAQRIGIPDRYLALGPHGWFPRYRDTEFVIGCSRSLLDWTVLSRLRAANNVRYIEAADVVELTGDSTRVTGARIKSRATGEYTTIAADFVVDATGRNSAAPEWLTKLGLPAVEEVCIDHTIFYATRIYRAPAGAGVDFPAVNIQANPTLARVRGSGMLIPIEDNQWSVTLSGAEGGHPPIDDQGFRDFAADLPHPVIAELIAAAEPLGAAFGFGAPANRRRYFEKLSSWPNGFAVLGDANTVFNPVYGHGMGVIAQAALALRDGLQAHGPSGAKLIQRGIAKTAQDAWTIATNEDLRYPQTVGPRPGRAGQLGYRFQDWLGRASANNRVVAAAQMEVITLAAPPTVLLKPKVLLEAWRTRIEAPLTSPPFTPDEQRIVVDSASR
ncbi:NAD(P)/FAD-dependent oxidoreductase [Nocardia sp. CA-128927]|uniref:NAD(P)/FAD-dependent oxidoreductase n=1 Tax=Nocardia sp. CA-128927 TaxID=3239975 RepID=UPI003D954355